jgi:peptide/nickel transport system substrate-binding protein
MGFTDRTTDLLLTRRLSRRRLLTHSGLVAGGSLAVGLLAACGGSSDKATSTKGATASSPTSAAPAATATSGSQTGAASPTAGGGSGTGGGSPTSAPITLTATPIPAGSGGEPVKGGTFTYGTLGNIDYGSLDMTGTTGTFDLENATALNDAYIWLAADGSFVPGLAESWEVSDDSLSYTFKLREDVKFHDGTPLNAEAAKFNFDRMTNRETNPSGLSYSYLGGGASYKEAVVVDPFTFQINLNTPNVIFLYRMRRKYISPQSPTAVQKFGAEYFRNPVGCGPMKFVEWVEGDHLTLERFDDYTWGPKDIFKNSGPTHLDKLTHRIIVDLSTKALAFESGELDYAARINEEDMARFQDDDSVLAIFRNQMGECTNLGLNTEKAPTNDLAVRQAMGWAIDREGLVESVFFGLLDPATNLFTKDMWSYDASLESLMGYDPDKAGQILDDAGWVMDGDVRKKDGQELRMVWLLSQEQTPVGQFVQANLAEIGIAVDLQVLAGAGLTEATLKGQHNIAGGTGGWVQEDPDVVRNWLLSSLIDVRQNPVRVRRPELDDLLLKGNAYVGNPHDEARAQIYRQIQAEVMNNAYVIPLYYRKGFEVGHPYVKFEQFGFLDFDPYGSYHEWLEVWLEK